MPFELREAGAFGINPNYFPGVDSIVCVVYRDQETIDRELSIPTFEDGSNAIVMDLSKEDLIVLVHPYVNNRTVVQVSRSYRRGDTGYLDVEVVSGDVLDQFVRPAVAYIAPRDPNIRFLEFRRMGETITRIAR